MKGGRVDGGYTLTPLTEMRYYAETLDWKHNNVRTTYYYGGGFSEVEVLDGKHKAFAEDMRWVVRGFEGVLYELSENVVGEAPVCDCEEVFTAKISGEETEYCPPYSGRYCETTEDGTRTLEFPEGELTRVLTYVPVLGIANEETISDMRCVIAEFGMGAGNPRAYISPDGTEYEVSSLLYLFSRDSKGKTHILQEYTSDIYALRCIKYLDRLKRIDSGAVFDASYGCAEENMKLTAEGIYLTKTGRLAAVVKVTDADGEYKGFTPERLNSALKKWGEDSLYALCVLSPSAVE